MDITTGNAYDADTEGTGWLVGFSPWTLGENTNLLHVPRNLSVSGLCMKWFDHPAADDSGPYKPLSEGRTLSVLVSPDSEFEIAFSLSPDFNPEHTRTVVLNRHGDYAAWGPGLFHRWHAHRCSTILTLRWIPNA